MSTSAAPAAPAARGCPGRSPDTKTVRICTAVDTPTEPGEDDTLTGGAVLPGFAPGIRGWFERAGARSA